MMPISGLKYRVVAVSIAAFALARCGGGATSNLPVSTAMSGQPRVAPELSRGDLIYVSSSYSFEVAMFTYPRGKQIGALTGLDGPQGMCAGKTGDVWVANTDGNNLIEYAHGGTSPIKTLLDTDYYPVGCSVDRATGNLAVSDVLSATDGAGNVMVYKSASGSGTAYTVPNVERCYFVAYDDNGDLYVDGEATSSGGFG
jgi:streptogramin lyase